MNHQAKQFDTFKGTVQRPCTKLMGSELINQINGKLMGSELINFKKPGQIYLILKKEPKKHNET